MADWFSRLRNWVDDNANGIGILADNHDQEDDNFEAGINLCLNIAGNNSPTADIPMDGHKFTGAGEGTAANHFATLKQVQFQTASYAVDSAGADAYAVSLSPAPTAYTAGMVVRFKVGTSNTGAATLNVNGLGAQSIKKDKNADLSDNDLVTGQVAEVIYDGTNFQLLSPVFGLVSQNGAAIYAADGGVSDAYAITLSPAPTAYTTGMVVRFKANTANTGAATLNVNSLGAKTIKKDGILDLADNDIKANQLVELIYDGTNFQMLSSPSNLVTQKSFQSGSEIYAADAGAADAYIITLSPAPTAYATGMTLRFKANTANTGAASLNVNSLGAITIKKFGTFDLATGDIVAGQLVEVIYDGTNFQMLSAVDDINNLTAKASPDSAADKIKIWDASASTYKNALIQNIAPSQNVKQIVQTTKTDTFSGTPGANGSWADVTGLSVSITPSSTSSRVLVEAMVNVACGTTGETIGVRLLRGATAIGIATSTGSRNAATAAPKVGGSIDMACVHISWIDSPATTSATTYKIQIGNMTTSASPTFYVNRGSDDTDNAFRARAASSITASEIV